MKLCLFFYTQRAYNHSDAWGYLDAKLKSAFYVYFRQIYVVSSMQFAKTMLAYKIYYYCCQLEWITI